MPLLGAQSAKAYFRSLLAWSPVTFRPPSLPAWHIPFFGISPGSARPLRTSMQWKYGRTTGTTTKQRKTYSIVMRLTVRLVAFLFLLLGLLLLERTLRGNSVLLMVWMHTWILVWVENELLSVLKNTSRVGPSPSPWTCKILLKAQAQLYFIITTHLYIDFTMFSINIYSPEESTEGIDCL